MAKATKQPLGRGLSALLKDTEGVTNTPTKKEGFTEIPIAKIVANPFQPRTSFDQEALKALGQSIKALGVIQPITVRKKEDDTYELVTGERRLRASKLIGKVSIPAYVRLANDREMLEMALVENIQRHDLDPIEVALSYQRLIDEMQFTQEKLSERVGKKRATVTNYLRLLKLSPMVQMGIRDGFLSMGHGRCLVNLEETLQEQIYEKIIANQLSVRDTELLVSELNNHKKQMYNVETAKKTAPKRQPNYITKTSLGQMSDFLAAKVIASVDAKGKGKITISFEGKADFERIKKILS